MLKLLTIVLAMTGASTAAAALTGQSRLAHRVNLPDCQLGCARWNHCESRRRPL